jgi:NAD(P)-dependent dehydrogenase (short-subunit alcohol dehydrogenase family)
MTVRLFDLGGRTAIVTGSSRGIGRAIAERLAEQGARVVISSRKAGPCQEVASLINERFGRGTALAIAANISSKSDLQRLVDETHAEFGTISILVCNAATNPHYGPMSSLGEEPFRKVLENNVLANHFLIQMVVPDMRAARDGSIVIVASIAGLRGSNSIGAYGISKAADMQLVRNLAVELGSDNIRVNCLAPGVIKTDFSRALWEDPQVLRRMEHSTPLRRFGEPDDLAGMAVCLAAPAGRYITGQTIVIDGGDTIA